MKPFDLPIRYYRFFPGDAPLGMSEQRINIDPGSTALILVDVYHAAETTQGKDLVSARWDRAFWNIVDQCLVPLIACARQVKLPVIYVSNSSPRIEINRSPFGRRLNQSLGFDPTIDFREPDVNSLEFDRGESIQLFIPAQIRPQIGDYFIRKHTYDGFFETRLDSLLHNLAIRTLICAGFAEDVCVLFTLAHAVFLGYDTILVRDGTLATELPGELEKLEHTQRTTLWIESFIGPSTTSEQFIAAIAKSQNEGN